MGRGHDFARRKRGRKIKLDELLDARGAYDTKHQLAAVVAARGVVAGTRINNPGAPRAITPGLLSFGLGGYPVGENTFGAVPRPLGRGPR